METKPQIINTLREEFEQHVRNNSSGPFRLSGATSEALGQLVRSLEAKRQANNLTAEERQWLKEIDQIIENTANHHREMSERRGLYAFAHDASSVYDLKRGRIQEEPENGKDGAILKISEEEADRIISSLNKQFEEKVLKKFQERVSLNTSAESKTVDFDSSPADVPQGRNLQEHLSAIRAERPDFPFQDEDSHIDLSKLKEIHEKPE